MPSPKAIVTGLVSLVFLASTWAQQTPTATSEDPVLFRVGAQEEYRWSAVQTYGKRRTDLVPLLKSTEGVAMVVQEMAMTRALVLEGAKNNEFRDTTQTVPDPNLDDIYALRVYRTIAGECPILKSDEESKAYYDQNPQAFTLPVQVSLSRIILPENLQADKYPAEMWLGMQASAVAMGSARFEALVDRAREIAPKLKQGALGWVLLEGEQPLVKALATAKAGELVGPVKDGEYVYLLQVEKRREQALVPFDAVRHQIPRRAMEYCRETQKNRVKSTLFKQHGVSIDEHAIRTVFAQ